MMSGQWRDNNSIGSIGNQLFVLSENLKWLHLVAPLCAQRRPAWRVEQIV